MESYDVDKILEVFHSKDWSNYYDYQDKSNFKKNIWFKISKVKEFDFVRDLITKDLEKINPNYKLSEWITFLIYKKGDYFNEHIDGPSYNSNKSNTILSGGYLLNDEYEGGEFIVGLPTRLDTSIIPNNVGEVFLFGRNVYHRVKEVKKGIRYSLHFAVNKKKDII